MAGGHARTRAIKAAGSTTSAIQFSRKRTPLFYTLDPPASLPPCHAARRHPQIGYNRGMEGSQTERPNSGLEAPVQRGELSEREREILRLVATGASNKEIALQLAISPNTVKVHLRNVFAKISVASRTEAAMFAIREGLVQVPGALVPSLEPIAAPDAPALPAVS